MRSLQEEVKNIAGLNLPLNIDVRGIRIDSPEYIFFRDAYGWYISQNELASANFVVVKEAYGSYLAVVPKDEFCCIHLTDLMEILKQGNPNV
jgi:hypothetical protein